MVVRDVLACNLAKTSASMASSTSDDASFQANAKDVILADPKTKTVLRIFKHSFCVFVVTFKPSTCSCLIIMGINCVKRGQSARAWASTISVCLAAFQSLTN
eukprot:scaffold3953_cov169-Amphora_coffeaeformis.AAC.34